MNERGIIYKFKIECYVLIFEIKEACFSICDYFSFQSL